MPTGFGLMFGGLGFFLLMAALGYANNLLYFFVFFLLSVAISAMVITDRNVHRVKIETCSAPPCFANETTQVQIELSNTGTQSSYLIETKIGASTSTIESLTPAIPSTANIEWTPSRRGWHTIPKLQIQSTYPFGLLRSWKVYKSSEKILVFPARIGSRDFRQKESDSNLAREIGIFRELREYQKTDSPQRIDWRSSIKHQTLLTKNFDSDQTKSFTFTWDQIQHLEDFEARISQLCLWIDDCERAGVTYSLEVGGFLSGLSRGPAHLQKCLQFLAELTEEQVK